MPNERRDYYLRHRNRVGRAMLRAVLRAAATVEAAQMCNDLLEHEGLHDVGIVLEELTPSLETILRAELHAILVRESDLPRSTQMELIDRMVARMAPRRDGPDAVGMRERTNLARRPDLAGQLRRETENLQRGRR